MVVRGDGGFRVVDNAGFNVGRAHGTLGAAQIDAEERINPGRKARYDSYIPKLGGTNSREIVLKTPKRGEGPLLPSGWDVQSQPNGDWAVYSDEGVTVAIEARRELAIARAREYAEQAGVRVPPQSGDVYSTEHFQDLANKIGWAQVDDIRDVNGNLLLRVRAVQDDTRQKGAKEGYRDPKRIAALKKNLATIRSGV